MPQVEDETVLQKHHIPQTQSIQKQAQNELGTSFFLASLNNSERSYAGYQERNGIISLTQLGTYKL